jgi:mono/diheme cytochrome c family protein
MKGFIAPPRSSFALVMTLAVGCSGTDAPSVGADAGSNDEVRRQQLVDRGRYISNNLAACTFCHTPLNPDGTRDQTKLFSGVDCFLDVDPAPGVGCISTSNLTNHETGLKNATDDQIKKAIRDGQRSDDKNLASLMPYWVFHNMEDSDLDALVAYIRTLPGVDHRVAANEEPWRSENERGPRAQPIDPASIPMPPAGPDQARAIRGRYLSSMAGLCIDCHTAQLPPGSIRPIDISRPFAGGRVWHHEELGLQTPAYPPQVHTRNLTPDATGLAGWSVEDIARGTAEGKDREGRAVCAATHGNTISPYAALEPRDLADIALYVSQLPAIANDTGPDCRGPMVP